VKFIFVVLPAFLRGTQSQWLVFDDGVFVVLLLCVSHQVLLD
jgi:hypothetical protein